MSERERLGEIDGAAGFAAFWGQREAILTSTQFVKDGALTQAVEYIRQLLGERDEAREDANEQRRLLGKEQARVEELEAGDRAIRGEEP